MKSQREHMKCPQIIFPPAYDLVYTSDLRYAMPLWIPAQEIQYHLQHYYELYITPIEGEIFQ